MKKLLIGAAVAALLASTAAFADAPGTAVSQTASHPDAAAFWIGQANGATSCNAVSQTAAQDTVTIPAVAGSYVYITELIVQFSTDATGATAVPTISMTGLGAVGLPAFLSAATTLSTTGYHADLAIPFPVGGLRSTAPGTAVTFVPSATLGAHSILCMSAVGYYSSN